MKTIGMRVEGDVVLADGAGKGESGTYHLQMVFLVCMWSGRGGEVIACTEERQMKLAWSREVRYGNNHLKV